MKPVLITLVLTGCVVFGQARPNPTGWGSVLYPGTGGPPPPSAHGGFGSVLYPGTGGPPPANAPNFGHGVAPLRGSRLPVVAHPQHSRGVVVAYPVFYGGYYSDPNAAQAAPGYYDEPNNGAAPSQPPVVILNQNYRPDIPNPANPPNPAMRDYSNAPLPPAYDVQANDQQATIYLIALTDHSILAAIAYWVEGDTLAYITQDGNQNRISLALVDRDFSKKLNDDRHVEFRLPKP